MATITPTIVSNGSGYTVYQWEEMATGDTFVPITLNGTEPLAGFFQAKGTFGSGTVVLQGSNDGTTWVTLKSAGTDISLTAAGGFDFSTAAMYIRPSTSGGTADDVDVLICIRG